MEREFQDRSKVLFGRGPDLAHSLGRAPHKGMTAVTGRALMGKSWLLTELARQLSQDASPLRSGTVQSLNLHERPSYLVGFTESLGETSDLLLRAVADLYMRWLSDSTWAEQAYIIWEQQKRDFFPNVGKAVGTILEKLSKLGNKPGEAIGDLVKETFDGLANANRELLTGGLHLSRLQIDQGRELLALVFQITDWPLVLVFDQWEKSPAIDLEAKILDAFVRHLDEWPPCHIFVGLRPDERPLTAVKELRALAPGTVEIYDLPAMHLDESSLSAALIAHVRERVPAAADVAGEELLDMISGYPGTVARWTSDYYAQRVTSGELRSLAADANAYRFKEFAELLPTLTDDERRLALRLAVLPMSANEEIWKALREIVLEGLPPRHLDSLKRRKLLEAHPPTFLRACHA